MLLYYGTRRQCIVCLSSLVVLAKGNFLEWGQLFSRKILWWVGNFPGGGSYPRGQFSGGQSSRGKLSGEQLPRGAIFPGGNCPDTYLSEEFYTTEQKILNPSICIFQPSGKIKIAGSYWDVDFPLFLFHLFLETMLLSKSLISRIFFDI